jgi:hypothetical protein
MVEPASGAAKATPMLTPVSATTATAFRKADNHPERGVLDVFFIFNTPSLIKKRFRKIVLPHVKTTTF